MLVLQDSRVIIVKQLHAHLHHVPMEVLVPFRVPDLCVIVHLDTVESLVKLLLVPLAHVLTVEPVLTITVPMSVRVLKDTRVLTVR